MSAFNRGLYRHCEARSEEAIQLCGEMDCFAALAMTASKSCYDLDFEIADRQHLIGII